MREYGQRRKDPPIKTQGTRGFPYGLNELTHPSAIKNNELAECKNAVFDQNGVIKKRPGSKLIGATRDASNSKINALQSVYDIGGENFILRIADDGILQKYNPISNIWVDVSGSPTFSNKRTYILQGYGCVYIMNENDIMRKWDGTTWTTWTHIDNPTTAPTLVKQASGQIQLVNVAAGGSGYAVGNILTPAGGDGTARLKVEGVTGSTVTSVSIQNGGSGYLLANNVTTTVDPAGGTNCKINITSVKGVGTRSYSYKYVFFNDIGNTLASNGATVDNLPQLLSQDAKVEVTIPTPYPSGVEKVGIFRGDKAGEERYLASIEATESKYVDDGKDVPDDTYSTPEGNTTSGYHFKFAAVYKDTILGVTTEHGDDTIVFSGGLDAFDVFAVSEGGGTINWRKGDGAKLTCLKPFKEELYVFKTNKVGALRFDTSTGVATIRDINLSIGAISQDSVHEAGNDLRGFSYDGIFSLGNEPNFADVVRSKLLSPRVQKTVDSITHQDIYGIASIYHKNISMWAIPMGAVGEGNTAILTYDERYAAWSLWTGMKASCFTKFIDSNNEEHIYYGSSNSGNVSEMMTGTNDNGLAIPFRIGTKQYDMGVPYKYKTYARVYLLFGLVSGSGTRINLLSNTNEAIGTYPLYISIGSVGFGTDEWGTQQFGVTGDLPENIQSGLIIRYIDLSSRDYFNIQAIIDNSGLDDQIEVMGIFFEYSESERPLPSSYRLSKES